MASEYHTSTAKTMFLTHHEVSIFWQTSIKSSMPGIHFQGVLWLEIQKCPSFERTMNEKDPSQQDLYNILNNTRIATQVQNFPSLLCHSFYSNLLFVSHQMDNTNSRAQEWLHKTHYYNITESTPTRSIFLYCLASSVLHFSFIFKALGP